MKDYTKQLLGIDIKFKNRQTQYKDMSKEQIKAHLL